MPVIPSFRAALRRRCPSRSVNSLITGDQVTWKTFYEDKGSVQQLTIQGTRSKLGVFTLSEPVPAKRERTGTEVNGLSLRNFKNPWF